MVFPADETTDIGYESGTTVAPDYDAHSSRFSDKLHWVQLDVGKDDHLISPDERLRVAMAPRGSTVAGADLDDQPSHAVEVHLDVIGIV